MLSFQVNITNCFSLMILANHLTGTIPGVTGIMQSGSISVVCILSKSWNDLAVEKNHALCIYQFSGKNLVLSQEEIYCS